jgi:hypothetical protein
MLTHAGALIGIGLGLFSIGQHGRFSLLAGCFAVPLQSAVHAGLRWSGECPVVQIPEDYVGSQCGPTQRCCRPE